MNEYHKGQAPAEELQDQNRILAALDGINYTTTLDLAARLNMDRGILFNRLQRMKRRELVVKMPVSSGKRKQAAWRRIIRSSVLRGWGWA